MNKYMKSLTFKAIILEDKIIFLPLKQKQVKM